MRRSVVGFRQLSKVKMKRISLSQGKFALVDDEDFEFLSQWKWSFHKGYAVRTVSRIKNGKLVSKHAYMHREVNETPDGFITDHINGNKLDNRRANLRSCTSSQNAGNRKVGFGVSKYKGVSWDNKNKKWKSTVKFLGKSIHLGFFLYEGEAAEAYNKAAVKYFGEFANLNLVRK